MGVPAESCNLYDLEEDYRDWLSHFLQSQGAELSNIYLGHTLGDLVRVPLRSIDVPVDFLIAGPPCPPWSGQGGRQSFKDGRSDVFVRLLQWVIYLIASGGLLGVVLENVVGISYEIDGRISALSRFMRTPFSVCCFRHSVCWIEYALPPNRARAHSRTSECLLAGGAPQDSGGGGPGLQEYHSPHISPSSAGWLGGQAF